MTVMLPHMVPVRETPIRAPVRDFFMRPRVLPGDPSAFLYGAMRSMQIAYVPD